MVENSNQGLNPDGIDQELTDLEDETLNEILIELVKMRNSQEQTVKIIKARSGFTGQYKYAKGEQKGIQRAINKIIEKAQQENNSSE